MPPPQFGQPQRQQQIPQAPQAPRAQRGGGFGVQVAPMRLESISRGGINLKRVPQPSDEPIDQGETVGASLILDVSKVPTIFNNLKSVSGVLDQVPGSQQGPILGRLSQSELAPVAGSLVGNPNIANAAQGAQSFSKAVTQQFGRYMEGGVLRKEDEIKYFKMMPNLSDPKPVQKYKSAVIQKVLAEQYNSDIKALGSAGYNVSSFEPLAVPKLPPVPGGFRKQAEAVNSAAKSLSTAGVGGVWNLPDGRKVRAADEGQVSKLRALGASRVN